MNYKKITTINSEYLAKGMNFMGFRFQQRTGEDGIIVYTFEETKEFLKALHEFMKMKQMYRQ